MEVFWKLFWVVLGLCYCFQVCGSVMYWIELKGNFKTKWEIISLSCFAFLPFGLILSFIGLVLFGIYYLFTNIIPKAIDQFNNVDWN